MCGIFGLSLKKNPSAATVKMALAKFKILGLYNESRGKDSCGVFIDNKVTKGVSNLKHFDDFIEETDFSLPKENFVMIGHTRQSTKGSHIEKNAHPFIIKDNLVGVHNGIIQNIEELCKKFEFDAKAANCDVDSHMLYHLIDQEGFGVLNEYIGYAALAFTYLGDPNTLYLYHGASKQFKAGKLIEERPLFFMETAEGIYFSSLQTSLAAIKDNEKDVIYMMEHNHVYQIKYGKFTDATWVIEREEKNITNVFEGNSDKVFRENSTGKRTMKNSEEVVYNTTKTSVNSYESLIMRETLPLKCHQNKGENFIYSHMGRYWRNKRTLCTGEYHLLDRGFISPVENMNGSKKFFFYRGVMLKDEAAFRYLLDIEKNNTSFVNNKKMNFAACMSRLSRFPITNLPDDNDSLQDYHKNAWYHEEKRFSGSFTPKYSGRHYEIKEGFLYSIKSSQSEKVLHDSSTHAEIEVAFYEQGKENTQMEVLGGTSKETFPSAPRVYVQNPRELEFSCGESCEYVPAREKKPFYEQKFESINEAMEVIGRLEVDTLRKYCRQYLEENSPLEVDDREVEIAVFELIDASVKNKVPIIELCDSEEDRYKLESAHTKVLDLEELTNGYAKSKVQPPFCDDQDEECPKDVIEDYLEKTTLFNQELANDQDMVARDTIEDIVDTLENMVNEAESLTQDVESDLAQDTAFAIYKGVSTTQEELRKVAEKHELTDLLIKLKAINRKRTMA